MKRREAVKVLGLAAAAPAVGGCAGEPGAGAGAGGSDHRESPPGRGPAGTPSDPDLLRPKVTWEKQLSSAEVATLTALCDLIIPADQHSPSASQVGVPDFINEWVSAPYEYQRAAAKKVRDGLAWLDREAVRRVGRAFASLMTTEQSRIADDIAFLPRAKPGFETAAEFFDLIRDLTATGFYTTIEGMKDLGYVGNVALPRYDGPPNEVLAHLGLTS
jgi:hypothetical protein